MSFEIYNYSVDKDPYDWCLTQSKRLKAIDPQMKIQMSNNRLLTQMPGELEHAIKFRCNQSFTLDVIANTLQDLRKRTNIEKYSPYKSNSFREKISFRLNIKDKPKERIAEFTENTEENRPEFAIGEEPLGKIRGHDIELYLDVERPYPPMLRRHPYSESLETKT
ncbi:hypothetical protein O181_011060 [Austropuccinia psidii MF-1]|uniref:Uncharacterized protein n=1 Tax=Austropuccinia psidii MF-1 TaxID=1389203 RepID=A0A9Q3BV62_9BASI|nr:hypothetical protein [Austropuccinia psidii MF-1]